MLICGRCKGAFEYPESRLSERLEHFGTPCRYTYSACPFCGSEELMEARRCEICGEWRAESELKGGLCEVCRRELMGRIRAFVRSLGREELEFIEEEEERRRPVSVYMRYLTLHSSSVLLVYKVQRQRLADVTLCVG